MVRAYTVGALILFLTLAHASPIALEQFISNHLSENETFEVLQTIGISQKDYYPISINNEIDLIVADGEPFSLVNEPQLIETILTLHYSKNTTSTLANLTKLKELSL
ncbi:hypothetical protein HY570_02030, partial [Candidatus Micrarchaeota archaeon]|nr:hypothetical protein [Candidatus Micrarchaeota archaeon]